SAVELRRSGITAVVDGATALASMVPADVGPRLPISHIWYTVPGLGGATLFITSTPAFFSREKTTVAVPPPGIGPDTVWTSGAANTCSVVEAVGAGRSDSPATSAPRPMTTAAAAAKSIVRQWNRRWGGATAASRRLRISSGGSTAVAADATAIVSRTARTSLRNASATAAGAEATRCSMADRSSAVTASSAYGVAS